MEKVTCAVCGGIGEGDPFTMEDNFAVLCQNCGGTGLVDPVCEHKLVGAYQPICARQDDCSYKMQGAFVAWCGKGDK